MKAKILVVVGMALALAGGVAVSVVAAEDNPKMTVSPAITEWIVNPGENQTKEIVLHNTTGSPLPVRTVAQRFTPREKVAKGEEAAFDASSWLEIKDPDFILKANESRKVSARLHVPKQVSPGGHYATIYFQELGPASGAQQTNVVGRVGTLVFITVKGNVLKHVKSASPLQVQRSNGNYTFAVQLQNTGNTHVLPTVSYTVTGMRGKKIAEVVAPPGVLLPVTSREYTATWHPPLMGHYTIVPHISYGDSGQQVALASVKVWQIPWRSIVPIAAVPLVAWFGGYRIRRRWQRAWRVLWKSP